MKIKNNLKQIKSFIYGFLIANCIAPITVFAANNEAVDSVNDLCREICNIVFYIGIIMLAWGLGMLVLSFKTEDADSKVKATMLVIVAVILISIKPIIKNLFGFDF